MAVALPAHILLRNARLQLCSCCLHALFAIVVVLQFLYFGGYGKKLQLEGSVQVLPAYTQTVAQVLRDGNPQDVCSRFKRLEEWHDAAGNRYGNHTCVPICGNASRDPCVKHKEAVFSESPGTLFVATQIQDQDNQSGAVQNYFVSSAEAVSVHLIIDYRSPLVTWYSSGAFSPEWQSYSSSKDAHIRVIDKSGEEVRSFAPGSAIILSVSEMLDLAGVGSLDTVEPLAGLNHMPGAHALGVAGPTRRLNGMRLNVHITCGVGGDRSQCDLRIIAETGTWISDSTFCNLFNGNDSYCTCRGIRIKSIFGGAVKLPDLHAIFINISASLVFFQIPKHIIFVTAIYLCGKLSTVYRNVVHRRFDITTEAGAMIMRLLQHEVAFNELDTAHNNGTLSGSISKVAVGASLRHILARRQHMDAVVINQMADFALTEVTKQFEYQEDLDGGSLQALIATACYGVNQVWDNLKEAFGYVKQYKDHNLHVDVDKFTAACSSTEPISLKNFGKLFDGDRQVSFMERFFMPNHFKLSREEIQLQHAQADQGVASRPSLKSKLAKIESVQEELKSAMVSVQEDLSEVHSMTNMVQEQVSEEHRELQAVQAEESQERREMNIMKEQINALTLRLDELQCKLDCEQPRALKEGVSEQCSEKDMMTGKTDAFTMAEQIKEPVLCLEQQQRKHEFELLQVQRKIDSLEIEMHRINQMFASPQIFDIKAERSTIPLSSTHPLARESRNQAIQARVSLVDDAQSEGHQKAKDFSCTMVDGKTSTQKDSRHTELQLTGPSTCFVEPHCLEEATCELRANPLAAGYKSASSGSQHRLCFY